MRIPPTVTVIILAGGFARRWNRIISDEKQFAHIDGVPVIENTFRLLQRYTVDVVIVVRDDLLTRYEGYGYRVVTIPASWSAQEYYKIKATTGLWNQSGRTVILMGDVWFTEKAMDRIILFNKHKVMFFGRQRRSFFTGCRHGEMFAISFWGSHTVALKEACKKLERFISEERIHIAGGWGLYDIVSSMPFLMYPKVKKGFVLNSNFRNIHDLTDDIDSEKDYYNLIDAVHKSHLSNVFRMIYSSLYYSLLFLFNACFELFVHIVNKRSKYKKHIEPKYLYQ